MENISTLITIIKHLALVLKDPTLSGKHNLSTDERTKKRDESYIALSKCIDLIESYNSITSEINELCELFHDNIESEVDNIKQ